MRRLLLAFLACGDLQAAIVHVQSLSATGSGTTLSKAITVSADSTILVGCGSSVFVTTSSVTDGTNTYTLDEASNGFGASTIARASNVGAATYTVVCNFSGSTQSGMTVDEYTGMANSSQPRAVNGANGFNITTPAADGGSVTGTGGTVGSAWSNLPNPGQWSTTIVAYKAVSGNDLFFSFTMGDNNANSTFTAPTSMTLGAQITTGGVHLTCADAYYIPAAAASTGTFVIF